MRNRVRDEIRRFLASEASAAERDVWQDAYAGLDAARISTIHGLCGEILRSHPAEANVDPRFAVLDEGQAALLLRQTLDETLAAAAEDAETARLFDSLGEQGLRQTLETLLRRRLEAAPAFAVLPTDVMAHWATELAARQQAALDALTSTPAWRRAAATGAWGSRHRRRRSGGSATLESRGRTARRRARRTARRPVGGAGRAERDQAERRENRRVARRRGAVGRDQGGADHLPRRVEGGKNPASDAHPAGRDAGRGADCPAARASKPPPNAMHS